MTSQAPHRCFVVRKTPGPVLQLLAYARAILAAMNGNAHFPSPNPPLSKVTASCNGLDAAQAATKTRAPGSIAARDAARTQLVADLHTLTGYVQQTADANLELSEAIITSASLAVRRSAARVKPAFAVKLGPVSGSAHLVVKAAGGRGSYEWAYSTDGGKTWVDAPPTTQAKATITGLPVATTVQFRFRAIVKTGPTDWSQPLSLVVR